MPNGGEDEGRIWNERILEILENKPQKFGVVGKFLKHKHSKFTFLEMSAIHKGFLLRKNEEKRNFPLL